MKTIPISILAGGLLCAMAPAQPLPHYAITDLGTLGGAGTNSTATDVNALGWVAGSSNRTPGGPQHAFLWYGFGPLHDLGTLDGPACPTCNSGVDGPNLLGWAAVGSETAKLDPHGEDFCAYGTHHQCLAAVWKNGRLNALPNLPGGNNANAFELNDLGEVVGFAENGVADATCAPGTPFQAFRFEAVVWDSGGHIRQLAPLAGDTVGFAFGVNDFGQVVGGSGLCSNTSLPPANPAAAHAVLWQSDGTPVNLGSLGGESALASAVNNLGVVVGGAASSVDGTLHAFRWTRQAGMQDYGAFPGAIVTVPPCCRTINDLGQIVGFAIDGNTFESRALVWQGRTPVDMNTLIPANSPWYLTAADSIDDFGQVVGVGMIHGEMHAFLATPR